MFLGGKSSSAVVVDTMQDLTNTMATYENGVLTMQFTRKQNTGDSSQVSEGVVKRRLRRGSGVVNVEGIGDT